MPSSAALVGCGRMGRSHALVLRNLAIPLVGIVDPVVSARSSFSRDFSGRAPLHSFANMSELLSCQVPDLLIIASTADCHASQTLHAMQAGVRLVLTEKPLATSMRLCSMIEKICLNSCSSVAVNHQMRFLPQYCVPKRLLMSPSYGGFQSMHVSAGNFGMAMNAIHYFEAFRFLADEPPLTVSAWFDGESLPNPRGPQFTDVSGCIKVSTASGRRLYIDASADQGHGVQVTYMSRYGRITIDELTGAMTTVVREAQHRDAPTSRYGMPVQIHQQQIPPIELVESTEAVLQALIAGENYPTLADGTLAVKTLVAAYHSHRHGGNAVLLASIADDDPEDFSWA